MNCPNCKLHFEQEKRFCSHCGTPLVPDEELSKEASKEESSLVDNKKATITENASTEKKSKKQIALGIAIGVAALLAIEGGIVVAGNNFWNKGSGSTMPVLQDNQVAYEKPKAEQTVTEAPTPTPLAFEEQVVKLNKKKEQALVSFSQKETGHVLKKEEKDKSWDATIFYGIDNPIEKYPKINCRIEGRMLNTNEGNMKFLVYRDVVSGKVLKISSFKMLEDSLNQEIDYYYTEEGLANFVFVHEKKEDIFPTHATVKQNGDRYYFDKDTFVRFRTIVDGKQRNYTTSKKEIEGLNDLPKGAKWYWMISSEEKEEMKKVAKKKKQEEKNLELTFLVGEDSEEAWYYKKGKAMLQQAYDVFAAINASEAVNIIEGTINDGMSMENTSSQGDNESTDSGPDDPHCLGEVKVSLYEQQSDKLLWETTTDANGKYRIYIPSIFGKCYRVEFEKDGYVTEKYYKINSNMQAVNISLGDITLCDDNASASSVRLCLRDATDATGNDCSDKKTTVKIRRGINNYVGDVYREVSILFGKEEEIGGLEPGNYTLEMEGMDYENTYRNICYNNGDTIHISISPRLEEDEIRVVLEWGEKPNDLDAHMLLPGISTSEREPENPYHIWYANKTNHPDNDRLDVDDTDGEGPETVTLHNVGDGEYRYYLVDYTNSSAEKFNSTAMSYSDATVTVYAHGKEPVVFHVPEGRSGIAWEVFKIQNKEIVPVDHYYDKHQAKSLDLLIGK